MHYNKSTGGILKPSYETIMPVYNYMELGMRS